MEKIELLLHERIETLDHEIVFYNLMLDIAKEENKKEYLKGKISALYSMLIALRNDIEYAKSHEEV